MDGYMNVGSAVARHALARIGTGFNPVRLWVTARRGGGYGVCPPRGENATANSALGQRAEARSPRLRKEPAKDPNTPIFLEAESEVKKPLCLAFAVLASLAFAGPANAAPATRASEDPPPSSAADKDIIIRIQLGLPILVAPTASTVDLKDNKINQNGHAIIFVPAGSTIRIGAEDSAPTKTTAPPK
ncbi:hypothetical protein AB0F81_45130 [Actinoplanes sp. NPDC024001]|uniref:hypothetical protein n=1 Tax=Actinoplanes sp. NPDC024001 TaxID=3154598 RepID=UPI0033C9DC78